MAMLTYHTTGRLLIQAAGGEMNGEDAAMFSELTAVGKRCTEYEPTGLTATPGPMTVDWACKFLPSVELDYAEMCLRSSLPSSRVDC